MELRLKNNNEQILTGMVREQYLIEWVFLAIMWVVSVLCAFILISNLLLLPTLGPPWTPTPDTTWWQWLIVAMQHPFVWPAAIATIIALIITIGLTAYFAIWTPSRVDLTIRLELSRIGPTTKLRLHRQYVTQIDSKGILITRMLPKTDQTGEYGLVILKATFPNTSKDILDSLAQRYLLARDKFSIATVSSLDELHFKISQLARAFDEI